MVIQRWLAAVIIIAVVAVGAGAGCIYYQDVSAIRDVEVTITDASLPSSFVSEILFNASLTVTMQIQLDNTAGRDISGMIVDFDVSVGNIRVGDGGFSGVDVPAHGTTIKTMTVTLRLVDVTTGLLNAIKQKSFTITLDGQVSGDVLFGLTSFHQPFTASYAFP